MNGFSANWGNAGPHWARLSPPYEAPVYDGGASSFQMRTQAEDRVRFGGRPFETARQP